MTEQRESYGSTTERAFCTYWKMFAPAGVSQPEEEYRFHPTRRWRFDFAWPEQKVAVELHGATYARGRHTRGPGFDKDRQKVNAAQIYGWTVLEYSARVLRDNPEEVIKQIVEAVDQDNSRVEAKVL